jgi:hypothetical protein
MHVAAVLALSLWRQGEWPFLSFSACKFKQIHCIEALAAQRCGSGTVPWGNLQSLTGQPFGP